MSRNCISCSSSDYANAIYDSRRANFYDYACAFSFANGNVAGRCNDKNPAVAKSAKEQSQLVYREPNSFGEYMKMVHATTNSIETNENASSKPTATCSIAPCGNSGPNFSTGCASQTPFQRRMRYNGSAPFKPASALPILDTYQWSQPESLYVFDTEEEYEEAFNGIYNGNLPLRRKFNFQNPKEQQRLWNGIGQNQQQPKQPKQPTLDATNCDCQSNRCYSTSSSVPIPYYRNYLESQYACGCNQKRCRETKC